MFRILSGWPDLTERFDLPEVEDVHDLHIWVLSTTETALTVHLVVGFDDVMTHGLVVRAREGLTTHFDVHHVTVQVETTGEGPTGACQATTEPADNDTAP